MGRLARGISGSFGFYSAQGAVTPNSGMVLNVAAVAANSYSINGADQANAYDAATVTIGTADAANPRVDIVWINTSGAVAVAAGAAAATPVPPTIGATGVELAMVLVGVGVTTIGSSDIINRTQQITYTLPSKSGAALKFLRLNAAGTALEYASMGSLRVKTGGPGHVPIPDGSGSGAVVDGATNTYGAWVQLSASVADDVLVGHIRAYCRIIGGNGNYGEIQIGIGAATSEVVQDTQPLQATPQGFPTQTYFNIPIDPPLYIPSGSRIAVRTRTAYNTTASQWEVLLSAVNPANVESWSP